MDANEGRDVFSAPVTYTLDEQIAKQVREAIATRKLLPGQRLVERDLAESMQTSRGPVRDALKILENEGLVVRHPRRGTEVAELTVQDAEEIWSLREALELLAVNHILKKAETPDLSALDEVVGQIERQVQQGFTEFESIDLDVKFHWTLCQISGHKRVLEAFDNLSVQLRLLLLSYRQMEPGIWKRNGVAWHRDIVQALRSGDAKVARSVVRDHLVAAFETVVRCMAEEELTRSS